MSKKKTKSLKLKKKCCKKYQKKAVYCGSCPKACAVKIKIEKMAA